MSVTSDVDQLQLALYQVYARGVIEMEKACYKSIVAQHEYCKQEQVCKVGGQVGEREIDQHRWSEGRFPLTVLQ